MNDGTRSKTTRFETYDTVEIVRQRLANGRTIADFDVHQLVAEIDRLRKRLAVIERLP